MIVVSNSDLILSDYWISPKLYRKILEAAGE